MVTENTISLLSGTFRTALYILTTLHHLKANLKHSTYHKKLDIVHLYGNAHSQKKLLLICIAGVFEESNVPFNVG